MFTHCNKGQQLPAIICLLLFVNDSSIVVFFFLLLALFWQVDTKSRGSHNDTYINEKKLNSDRVWQTNESIASKPSETRQDRHNTTPTVANREGEKEYKFIEK